MIRNAWLRGSVAVTAALLSAPMLGPPALAATGGSGIGGLPQLDAYTYPTQIFWLVVTFVILYLIMSKVALPRIAEVLEERQERVADDIETAERLRSEAAVVQSEYEKALAEARGKAQELFGETGDELAREQAAAGAETAKKLAHKTTTAETRIDKRSEKHTSEIQS